MPSRRVAIVALLGTLLAPALGSAASSGASALTPQSPIPDNAVVTSNLQDDFSGAAGSAPDSSRWALQTSGTLFNHQNLAAYTTSPDNVALDGHGHLRITVRRDDSSGSPTYTSGFVTSKQLVGPDMHIEARIKLAPGYGMWPLFWIQGLNAKGAGWPATGEVDIAENPAKLPYQQWATAHGAAVTGGNTTGHWKSTTILTTPRKLSADFHTYGLDVTANSLTWTFDGRPYKVLWKNQLEPTWVWSFNAPFVVIFNVAVGGNFPGNPKPSTRFPSTMVVDYLRVTPN